MKSTVNNSYDILFGKSDDDSQTINKIDKQN